MIWNFTYFKALRHRLDLLRKNLSRTYFYSNLPTWYQDIRRLSRSILFLKKFSSLVLGHTINDQFIFNVWLAFSPSIIMKVQFLYQTNKKWKNLFLFEKQNSTETNVKTLESSIDGNRNFQIEKGVNAENFYKFQYVTIYNI